QASNSNSQPLGSFQSRYNNNKRPASSYYCSHCKIHGHSYERCFKVHGYPPGFKGFKEKKVAETVQHSADSATSVDLKPASDQSALSATASISQEQYNYLVELLQNISTNINADNDDPEISHSANLAGKLCLLSTMETHWVIDSGATDHVCNDLHSFSDCKPLDGDILIPDGKRVRITHIGTVILNDSIKLQHVLYAPDFKFNLISVPKLCKDMSCSVVFNHHGCFIQGHFLKEHQLPLGNIVAGLYHFKNDCKSQSHDQHLPIMNNVSRPIVDKAHLWHLRLGHLPFSQLKHLLSPFDVGFSFDALICQICPAAKQSRLPFPTSSIKSTRAFQLLHIDLWGPYKVKTHNGCNQFITIVDDFTRFTWTHLIKNKSDVASVLPTFAMFVETQFGAQI
ncbi:Retrovirus-related Pol polyprotein from transposon RE1, partial [Bienertia sinuspersici]